MVNFVFLKTPHLEYAFPRDSREDVLSVVRGTYIALDGVRESSLSSSAKTVCVFSRALLVLRAPSAIHVLVWSGSIRRNFFRDERCRDRTSSFLRCDDVEPVPFSALSVGLRSRIDL